MRAEMALHAGLAVSRMSTCLLLGLARRLEISACVGICTLLVAFAGPAPAAVPVDVVNTDLKPLIRAAAVQPVQFAVLVPHSVSSTNAGSWSTSAGIATWTYAVQVPTAVSLSFHAASSSLPDSAVLVVRGAKTTTSYRARDLRRGELWSRVHPGEALQLELSVAAAERSAVTLNIVSLQAGYRAIGAGVTDHPYYRELQQQAAQATGNAACVTNYECQVSSSNAPLAAATVGVIVEDIYQCTGVLINDVPGDNTPYLLTARHCQNGVLGGGNPGAASQLTVYWDATTPCGATLGSIYDPGVPTQTGASTIVEQQDAWLLLLDENPVVGDAQLAGFDASGGAVQGGYTIHHSEGAFKQFTGWFGQAAALQESDVLGVSYLSNFLETVNAIGNIGPGASGSALVDQNNHVVGSLTLGRSTTDPSGYGMCPATPLAAPNGTNGVADFTSLAAVWNSTADTTSTTGSTTLQSVLDPAGTGTTVSASAPVANLQFSASSPESSTTTPVALTWSATDASQCVASGGVPGDGWAGTMAASGTQSMTETSASSVTYTLSCTYAGGRAAKAFVSVNWVGPVPTGSFTATPDVVWTTRPAVLSWTSNVAPCAISGGGLSQSDLPTSDTLSTTQATAGEVTYTLTCGPSNDQLSRTLTVQYVTPSLILEPNSTDRILGQPFVLAWLSYGDTCISSGGARGDQWAGSSFRGYTDAVPPQLQFSPNVTKLGTYTYTLTCSSGSLSVQQSVTVTFENNAPYVNASLGASSVTYSDSPADYVTLSWMSNMANCGPPGIQGVSVSPSEPLSFINPAQGTATLSPLQSGTYTISVSCVVGGTTLVTSAPLTLTVLPSPPPTATISIRPPTVLTGQSFTVSYTSTNALNCTEGGGVPGFDWAGAGLMHDSEPPSGTVTGYAEQTGRYTFDISCQSIDPSQGAASARGEVSIEALSATLTVSASSIATGSPLTLTWWSSSATSCTASGGGANGSPWSGALPSGGSATQTATTVGSFSYQISCVNGSEVASAVQTVLVYASGSSSSSSSSSSGNVGVSGGGGGGGGGGALELLDVALLAGLGLLRSRSRFCAMKD